MGGVRNGGAAACMKFFIDPDCDILFFSDANCTPGNISGDIEEGSPTSCRTPALPGMIRSWAAYCQRRKTLKLEN
jgi:hypothetical protein